MTLATILYKKWFEVIKWDEYLVITLNVLVLWLKKWHIICQKIILERYQYDFSQ